LAFAYILFKLIAALIALLLYPITTPLLVRASNGIDGVTLLAAYHTAYNVVGVVMLLPLIDSFTRFVELVLPERGSPLTRSLDRAALVTPGAAAEAVRRTVALALETICGSLAETLAAADACIVRRKGIVPVADAGRALRQAQEFLSEASGPPESPVEQQHLTSTLHALFHASRLTEAVGEEPEFGPTSGGPDDLRAAEVCVMAMRCATSLAAQVAGLAAASDLALPSGPGNATKRPSDTSDESGLTVGSTDQALAELERCANELGVLRREHRRATLGSVASGALNADEAIARVDTVRRLEAFAHHAWRSAAHLVGRGA
jgi:phosphate:Na+ symporter